MSLWHGSYLYEPVVLFRHDIRKSARPRLASSSSSVVYTADERIGSVIGMERINAHKSNVDHHTQYLNGYQI